VVVLGLDCLVGRGVLVGEEKSNTKATNNGCIIIDIINEVGIDVG